VREGREGAILAVIAELAKGGIRGFDNNKKALSALLHCKENSTYVFLFWELRGLSPNFHIHLSMSHLYIPRISPYISLQQNRQTDLGNI
jgi:hypothetical protein